MLSVRQAKWPLLSLAILTLVSGCGPAPDNTVAPEEPKNEALPLPRLPVAEPPMDRAALLEAVARAASATALGRNDLEQQRTLDGKRFEVRIRFGCATNALPQKSPIGPFNVRFNADERTLRVRAAPDLTLDDTGIKTLAGAEIEAVEGFWMRRPWLLDDGCPQVPPIENEKDLSAGEEPPETPPPSASANRVGLAQFFTGSDPRTGRRDGRAYEATKVLNEGEQPSRQGYNLVLAGRLRKLPGERVIACRPITTDAPPECVVSADFDRVWIEVPGTSSIVAEWSS